MGSYLMETKPTIGLFNSIPIGICVIDANFKIICWNYFLESLTKLSAEETINEFLYDIYPEFKRKINILRIDDVAMGGPPAMFSASLNKTLFAPMGENYSAYYYEITASALQMENSDEKYVIFSIEDKTTLYKKVNDYKKVKDQALIEIEQRKIVEQSLQLANQSKDKFISIMAHDIKNPLGVIQSVSDFLLKTYDELEKDEIHEFLAGMFDSSKKVNELINDLLVWARSQSGQLTANLAEANILELITEEIAFLEKIAQSKSIKVTNNIQNDVLVQIDRNMVRTVIRNLISNAIKFTKIDGEIIVAGRKDGDYFEISVEDNGVGMKETDKLKLFKVGENVTKPGTNDEQGTGLGLLLCKEFIDLHKGRIWVESELGIGSKFKFTIPIATN